MTKFYLIAGIIIIVLVGAGVYFWSQNQLNQTVTAPATSPSTQAQESSGPAPDTLGAQSSQGYVVTYTDSGYSPATLTIKLGSRVTFVNQSSEKMWTASDPHPQHTGYPESGGCKASAFDECGGAAPGSSWSFVFSVPGAWGYHNHLDTGFKGKIIVEQ